MKFGKLTDISQTDFSFPKNHPNTLKTLNRYTNPNPLEVYIGCTGFSQKEWVGSVYPAKTKSKDFLQHYSKQFNTIEFNTTHYRIPKPETINKWKTTAEPGFLFCPKILQTISHSGDLGMSKESLNWFCDAIYGLDQTLGCSFMQMPPYWKPEKLPILEQFLSQFPRELNLAIELRHADWFTQPEPLEQFSQLLQTYNVSTVITDVAGRRDVLHQLLTTDIAMIRFVGNGLHPTDYKRIDDWVNRLKNWSAQGLRRVYFFMHQPDNIKSPEMIVYLTQQLNKELDLNLKVPMLNPGSSQLPLFS